jgi:hypothetical protein
MEVAVALVGKLEMFGLVDVLRSLAATSKTGCLRIEGNRGEGQVWLAHGDLVGAEAQRALPDAEIDEIFFELLRSQEGSFQFDAEEPAGWSPEDAANVETVLDRAHRLLQEWHELHSIVPSVDHRVRLKPDLETYQVTLDRRSWSTVTSIGPGKSVSQLATVLGTSEIESLRRVRDLLVAGVVSLTPPLQPPVAAQPAPRAEVSVQ